MAQQLSPQKQAAAAAPQPNPPAAEALAPVSQPVQHQSPAHLPQTYPHESR